MRIAFADPPYPGQSKRLYGDHPDYAGEVNHAELVADLLARFPDGWESTANQFRSLEWFICESRAELISALLNGHPVVVGRAGHSICYMKPMYQNGSLLVMYVNSWGDWGDAAGRFPSGFGYDSERMISQSSDWAFALRSVTTPGA